MASRPRVDRGSADGSPARRYVQSSHGYSIPGRQRTSSSAKDRAYPTATPASAVPWINRTGDSSTCSPSRRYSTSSTLCHSAMRGHSWEPISSFSCLLCLRPPNRWQLIPCCDGRAGTAPSSRQPIVVSRMTHDTSVSRTINDCFA
jgi:hypothetical protein